MLFSTEVLSEMLLKLFSHARAFPFSEKTNTRLSWIWQRHNGNLENLRMLSHFTESNLSSQIEQQYMVVLQILLKQQKCLRGFISPSLRLVRKCVFKIFTCFCQERLCQKSLPVWYSMILWLKHPIIKILTPVLNHRTSLLKRNWASQSKPKEKYFLVTIFQMLWSDCTK